MSVLWWKGNKKKQAVVQQTEGDKIMLLKNLFQAIMATEENILPLFIHNPSSQKIVGAVMVAESIFGQVFGLTTASTVTPAPAPAAPVAPAVAAK